MCVDHRKNINLVRFNIIDNSISALNYFANLVNFIFWNFSTRKGKISNLL